MLKIENPLARKPKSPPHERYARKPLIGPSFDTSFHIPAVLGRPEDDEYAHEA